MTSGVSTDTLRAFVTASDLGSFGRAAIRLSVSQPALSKRLQGLEQAAGVRLLERSSRGVTLTPAGRRLYEQAKRLLEEADAVDDVLSNLQRTQGPMLLAASHSATEAFVGDVLLARHGEGQPVELMSANSSFVRRLVAEGRAELGVAASRPQATPNPGIREVPLAPDEILYAVPQTHRWARRTRVGVDEFLREPVVTRDPASNARWTVETELRRHRLPMPPLLVQAATPAAARREAYSRNAPVLLSRGVLAGVPMVPLTVGDLRFARQWEAVLPAVGEPSAEVRSLIDDLTRGARAAAEGRHP